MCSLCLVRGCWYYYCCYYWFVRLLFFLFFRVSVWFSNDQFFSHFKPIALTVGKQLTQDNWKFCARSRWKPIEANTYIFMDAGCFGSSLVKRMLPQPVPRLLRPRLEQKLFNASYAKEFFAFIWNWDHIIILLKTLQVQWRLWYTISNRTGVLHVVDAAFSLRFYFYPFLLLIPGLIHSNLVSHSIIFCVLVVSSVHRLISISVFLLNH